MLNNYFFANSFHDSILLRMPEEEIYPFSEELKDIEESDSLEADSSELPPTNIIAFNELRSCADLLRMCEKGQLEINPDFQRGLVWKPTDQARFIDSLIKQLPIPSMCFSFDIKSEKRTVIDGLQRISTIISFLQKDDFQLSNINDIDKKIAGKTVRDIKIDNKDLWERVENLSIPVTVIRCNYTDSRHMDYLFTIFHRLNSGGTKLNNQEIRNCIYNGAFNSLLKELTKQPSYKSLFKIQDDKTYRFAFEELNLRFFAFSEKLGEYNGRLASFLNTYMFDKEKNKDIPRLTKEEIEEKRTHFNEVIDVVSNKIFNKSNKLNIEKISKTIIEAVLVGVSKNLKYIKGITSKEALRLYNKLRNDELFSIASLKEGLSQKGRVTARLKKAIKIFSGKQ